MVVKPVAPKIPAQLAAWDDEADDSLEIDRAAVSNLYVAGVTYANIDMSRLDHVSLTGLVLERLEISDAVCTKLESAGLRGHKARLLRVQISDSRMTGSELGGGSFEDCTFRNIKFDEAGFRFATFKRVHFENCMLRAADFGNARFTHVTFSSCDLTDTNFTSAHCSSVDIREQDIVAAKGVLGLKGATISSEQLMQLAPLLAAELGFRLED
ncbi:MAG TPA: pentapeptide repeat-containing protein [Candidatus Saccharimonadales bacterium]|nr:pentapeptide repeat-containing protein [Candidatus Saccharimonadales bacterium]